MSLPKGGGGVLIQATQQREGEVHQVWRKWFLHQELPWWRGTGRLEKWIHPINHINNITFRVTYRVEQVIMFSEWVHGRFPCNMYEEVWSWCGLRRGRRGGIKLGRRRNQVVIIRREEWDTTEEKH